MSGVFVGFLAVSFSRDRAKKQLRRIKGTIRRAEASGRQLDASRDSTDIGVHMNFYARNKLHDDDFLSSRSRNPNEKLIINYQECWVVPKTWFISIKSKNVLYNTISLRKKLI